MLKKKFPFYKQLDLMDCGPTCLKMVAKFYGKEYPVDFLREKSNITRDGVTLGGISDAAETIGLSTIVASVTFEVLKNDAPLPCIAHWRERHFVVVYEVDKRYVYIADPGYGLIKYTHQEFCDGWIGKKEEGLIMLLNPSPEFYDAEEKTLDKKGFSFLFPYFRPYRRIISQLIIGLFLGSLFQLIFPFLTQAVVDYGINYQNLNFVYLILIAQLVLFVSDSTVGAIRSWLLLHMTSRMNISLISDFLIKLMRLPISFYESKNIGDLMQRLQDHDRVRNFLSATSLNVLFSVVNVLIFGLILAYYHWLIFVVFFIGASLYVTWSLLFLKKRAEIDYKRFDQASGNQNSLIQLINGMQEIKLNGSEKRRRWEWEAVQIKLFKISIKSLTIAQTQGIGANFIDQLKNIVISFIAAKSVIEGQLSLGMMLSVQYIIGQLNLPISNFISFIQTSQDAKLSLERLSEIHVKENEDFQEDEAIKKLPADHSLFLEKVSFRYGGSRSPLVLQDINLSVPQNKITAIVGESGSGKTTLIKLLLKFYPTLEGNITIGNTNLSHFDSRFWRSEVGCVMQDNFIFSDTIVRNITESDSDYAVDKGRLGQAVQIANIESFIESLPHGYNTRIGASGMGLSGGQKQRILIARAIYKNPKFLFFDEATSSLDASNEKKIVENLKNFFEQRTVVVVAHRLSTVKNADNIVVINQGRLVEQGTHSSLVQRKGYYFNLVKDQLVLGE